MTFTRRLYWLFYAIVFLEYLASGIQLYRNGLDTVSVFKGLPLALYMFLGPLLLWRAFPGAKYLAAVPLFYFIYPMIAIFLPDFFNLIAGYMPSKDLQLTSTRLIYFLVSTPMLGLSIFHWRIANA